MPGSNILQTLGIGYACKKGVKAAPNQDDFCILVDGDTTILGVFDGHGLFGHFCSYTIQQLMPKLLYSHPAFKTNLELALKQTFLKLDEALRGITQQDGKFSALLSGTTASVVVYRDKTLYISHVGDSRVVLGRKDKDKIKAVPLSRDHCPELDDEKERVEKSNGEVRRQDPSGPPRVFGLGANYPGLAMSRAIGDEIAKSYGVIADPEVKCLKIESDDLFVTLSSDGVWEFLSNEKVITDIYKQDRSKVHNAAALVAENAFNAWLANEGHTTDDITCLIFYFN